MYINMGSVDQLLQEQSTARTARSKAAPRENRYTDQSFISGSDSHFAWQQSSRWSTDTPTTRHQSAQSSIVTVPEEDEEEEEQSTLDYPDFVPAIQTKPAPPITPLPVDAPSRPSPMLRASSDSKLPHSKKSKSPLAKLASLRHKKAKSHHIVIPEPAIVSPPESADCSPSSRRGSFINSLRNSFSRRSSSSSTTKVDNPSRRGSTKTIASRKGSHQSMRSEATATQNLAEQADLQPSQDEEALTPRPVYPPSYSAPSVLTTLPEASPSLNSTIASSVSNEYNFDNYQFYSRASTPDFVHPPASKPSMPFDYSTFDRRVSDAPSFYSDTEVTEESYDSEEVTVEDHSKVIPATVEGFVDPWQSTVPARKSFSLAAPLPQCQGSRRASLAAEVPHSPHVDPSFPVSVAASRRTSLAPSMISEESMEMPEEVVQVEWTPALDFTSYGFPPKSSSSSVASSESGTSSRSRSRRSSRKSSRRSSVVDLSPMEVEEPAQPAPSSIRSRDHRKSSLKLPVSRSSSLGRKSSLSVSFINHADSLPPSLKAFKNPDSCSSSFRNSSFDSSSSQQTISSSESEAEPPEMPSLAMSAISSYSARNPWKGYSLASAFGSAASALTNTIKTIPMPSLNTTNSLALTAGALQKMEEERGRYVKTAETESSTGRFRVTFDLSADGKMVECYEPI